MIPARAIATPGKGTRNENALTKRPFFYVLEVMSLKQRVHLPCRVVPVSLPFAPPP